MASVPRKIVWGDTQCKSAMRSSWRTWDSAAVVACVTREAFPRARLPPRARSRARCGSAPPRPWFPQPGLRILHFIAIVQIEVGGGGAKLLGVRPHRAALGPFALELLARLDHEMVDSQAIPGDLFAQPLRLDGCVPFHVAAERRDVSPAGQRKRVRIVSGRGAAVGPHHGLHMPVDGWLRRPRRRKRSSTRSGAAVRWPELP